MSKQLVAAVAAVLIGASVVVFSDGADAGAAPNAPAPVAGTGPCSTEPAPTHEGLAPKTPEFSVPYPAITVVPNPPPAPPAPVRTTQKLPDNPCSDPCPDLTDEQPSGGSGSSSVLPKLIIRPQPFYFGIPVPGQNPAPTPPKPQAVNPPIEPAPVSAKHATPNVSNVTEVSKQTGAHSINRTDKRWQVQGTDLGIMWESAPGEIATAFGDTIGKNLHPPGGMGDDWRSNVLAFSTDKNLADGTTYDSMVQDSRCHAAELLSSQKLDNIEITTIPTSGFAIGKRQYMSYMSIRTWNSVPGTWFTNYGGIAYSDDHGQTWTKDPNAKWDNIFGLANFQVTAMVPQGDYVYMFGTRNTRLGDIGLARVPKDKVLNKTAYQYWANGSWTAVGGEGSASPIVPGTAAELSVRYNADRKVWQMSYLDTTKAAIVLRESDSPQGVWSEGAPLVGVDKYPELYGGFMHPWSTGDDLYFNISTWSDYNVYQMHAKVN
ncbi:DUF4185 domain-containing protein [Antrihabitans cavernicola]|uniref:DUF4185 domain-containing protein n=1 Tax=Antrihabitans cavernicola TaxID=2495913 RepID=A0A5A7S752_9NOCA|nr:DUF4185 domain-containing protein [Spelaeibacter cavernicola]KAA0021716.1 DUF4185 domain-containing protein [Spelaeibacter cavernicola]